MFILYFILINKIDEIVFQVNPHVNRSLKSEGPMLAACVFQYVNAIHGQTESTYHTAVISIISLCFSLWLHTNYFWIEQQIQDQLTVVKKKKRKKKP